MRIHRPHRPAGFPSRSRRAAHDPAASSSVRGRGPASRPRQLTAGNTTRTGLDGVAVAAEGDLLADCRQLVRAYGPQYDPVAGSKQRGAVLEGGQGWTRLVDRDRKPTDHLEPPGGRDRVQADARSAQADGARRGGYSRAVILGRGERMRVIHPHAVGHPRRETDHSGELRSLQSFHCFIDGKIVDVGYEPQVGSSFTAVDGWKCYYPRLEFDLTFGVGRSGAGDGLFDGGGIGDVGI